MLTCPKCACPIAGTSPGSRSWARPICPFCGADVSDLSSENVRQGELIGWRGVHVRNDENGRPRIWSPVYPTLWSPGETLTATCGGVPVEECGHRIAGDKAPAKGCGCGFYAARTRDHLLSLGYGRYSTPDNPDSLLCEVAQWGRVVIADNGFRAENVRLLRLYVPSDGSAWKMAKLLTEDYGPHGVEVVMADTQNLPQGVLPEWCSECGVKLKTVPGNKQVREPTCGFCGHYNVPVS